MFYASVLWGGFIWCTGNLTVVPTIQCIGLSLGMLLWGGTNLISGWAVGYFGLFGLNKQTPKNDYLNVMGVVICFSALSLMFFIKPNEEMNGTLSPSHVGKSAFATNKATLSKLHKSPSSSASANTPFDLESPSNARSLLSTPNVNNDADDHHDTDPLLHDDPDGTVKVHPSQLSWTAKLNPPTRRMVGISLALIGGGMRLLSLCE
jgi:hypothetical protein